MKKRFFAPSLTLSALLTLFGSCAAPKVQLDQLAGEWDVVEFDLDTARYEVKNLKEGSAPFFGFNLKEHRFYGSATCNSLMGSFKVDSTQAGSISIPGVASTRAFGPHMDLEQAIVGNLSKVTRYEVFGEKGDSLNLYDKSGKNLFKMARRPDYSALEGKWTVIKAKGKEIQPAEDAPFLTFNTRSVEKLASGNTGCNNFSGGFRLQAGNDSIHFGNMITTMRFCENVTWEQDMMAAFNETATYKAENGQLIFFDAKGNEVMVCRKE